jgi:small conductance mechanosensitive channel
MNEIELLLHNGLQMLGMYIPKVIGAIIALIIGFKVVGWLSKYLERAMDKKDFDVSIKRFLSSLFSILLKVLLFVSVISMLGVKTTSFVAILGAAGLAIGLALQGSLSNFAGGVLLLINKPFVVGNYVEINGLSGTVDSISIIYTILKTPDNKTIVIPNGTVSNSSITNFSTEKQRRLDLTIGIGYDDDIKKAKNILDEIVKNDKRVLNEPAPVIAVAELADSSVNFTVRMWCDAGDYFTLMWDMLETIKLTFDEKGINIPFPQTDVHLYKHNK